MRWPFISRRRHEALQAFQETTQAEVHALAARAHQRAQASATELVRMTERVATLEAENEHLKTMLGRCRYHAKLLKKP